MRRPTFGGGQAEPGCVACVVWPIKRLAIAPAYRAVENGHIKRVTDEDIQSSVLEVGGCWHCTPPSNLFPCPLLCVLVQRGGSSFPFQGLPTLARLKLAPLNLLTRPHLPTRCTRQIAGANVSTAFISCPADPTKTLGIKLPFLVMIIKNLNKYFTFEVQVRVAAAARGCLHRPCMHRRAAWRARDRSMLLQGKEAHRTMPNKHAQSPTPHRCWTTRTCAAASAPPTTR